jgi:hypothetical protein
VTKENARVAANVILGVAGIAAAYVVLTSPPLRRFVFRAARLWAVGGGMRSLLT